MQPQYDVRVNRLLDIFLQNGWEFLGSVDIPSDWWFKDILQLGSMWRPVGARLFLTLLTDPQDTNNVWCVGVSSVIPEDLHHPFIGKLTLNDISKVDLPAFVKKINMRIFN